MYIYIYTYMYIHTHIYIHTHKYIYTQKNKELQSLSILQITIHNWLIGSTIDGILLACFSCFACSYYVVKYLDCVGLWQCRRKLDVLLGMKLEGQERVMSLFRMKRIWEQYWNYKYWIY